MARPEIIAKLHSAYYDWLWDRTNPELFKAYRRLLEEVAAQYGTSTTVLQRTLVPDFRDWRRQEGHALPPLKD